MCWQTTIVPIDETMELFDEKLDKIKFKAFGKTTIRKRKPARVPDGGMEPRELLQKQNDRLGKEINDLKEMKIPKGSQIFKIAERIWGPKSQEPSAVKDPATNAFIK